MILPAGCCLRLFCKDMNDDDSLTNGRNVDGTDNSTTTLHAHLPKRTLEMLHVRLPNTFQSVPLLRCTGQSLARCVFS